MSLIDQVSKDIMQEMKNQNHRKLEALRAIKAALLLEKASGSKDISREKELQILQRLLKQRLEAAEIFKNEGRNDLYEKEMFQAEIIKSYLPAMLSKEEIEARVKDIVQRVGATSMKDMGKVMSVALQEMAGQVDNKMLSEIVKAILSSNV
ncbi:MAG: GatB/YqeY domain-containing protein [Bacteroidales bacterium]|nr:GatB/YqeY domain-containing protein [Bacteroidales bacterium]